MGHCEGAVKLELGDGGAMKGVLLTASGNPEQGKELRN